jgi:hypothetical protein
MPIDREIKFMKMWKECARNFAPKIFILSNSNMQVLIGKGGRLHVDISHMMDRKGKGK